MSTARGDVILCDTIDAFADTLARWLCARADARRGEFVVCLTGGNTPGPAYRRLASPPWLERFPWHRTHFFWGDERFVPHGHQDSNYRLACETFLNRAPVPRSHIHPISTEYLTLEEAAEGYEEELIGHYGSHDLDPARPLFDVVLLGIGTDGHIASLIPGDRALDEREHWTAPVREPSPHPHQRITLTLPALESARHVAFLVTGAGKRAILDAVLGGGDVPAARIRPVGETVWFIDRAAAGD